MIRSSQQERAITAVVQAVSQGSSQASLLKHVVLEAVAGAGKTYTLVEMVREVRAVRPDARILMLAFNVEMARQLRDRLTEHMDVDVCTIHAFGLRMLVDDAAARESEAEPTPKRLRRGASPLVDPDKGYHAWRRRVGPDRPAREWGSVRAAVDRHRQDGEDPPSAVAADDTVHLVLRDMVENRGVVDQERGPFFRSHKRAAVTRIRCTTRSCTATACKIRIIWYWWTRAKI